MSTSSVMNIAHFPTPYPDELLYSICARFGSRVDYPDGKSVLQELFGAATATVVIDLPNRLRKLAAGLPAGASLTTNCLIDRHTLLPFYSAFIPPERVRQIRKSMGGNSGPAAHMISGVMASRIPTLDFMRYCSVCLKEDEKKFRETFWRRLHQLPGVEVCPSHQVFLENSSVGFRVGRKHIQFIPAEKATRTTPVRHVDIDDRDHRALLQLARDAEWLLEHPSSGINLKTLYTRYLRMLVERGLATYTGSIHVKKLLDEFSSYHSPELLGRLNCELRGSNIEKSNWLLRLVRASKHAQHPLYHLLLIQFLDCTAEEFFQLPEELRPFGEGPWPCLNPVAEHYQQSVIIECQLSSRLRYGKPIGKFSCECGFVYVRTGPDSSPKDRFRVGKMISFGRTWEAELMELWRNSSLSLSEIGRQLGVDQLTARRHAARLKLPFSRSGRRAKPLKRSAQLKESATSAAREKKRRTWRSKWLYVKRQNPKITLKALRLKLPRAYAWLRQNDSEWLEGHKPRPQKRNLSTASVDWKKRDAEYAIAVKDAASRIKDTPSRPVQVTKTAIGQAIGAISLLRQKLHKMPLTSQVLLDVIETREEYAIRRVWWAGERYLQQGVQPSKWQLILRANVYNLREIKSVRRAIEITIQLVDSKLSHAKEIAS